MVELVIADLDCQLDYIWNEEQSRDGAHISDRFFTWFEVDKSTFLVWTFEIGN